MMRIYLFFLGIPGVCMCLISAPLRFSASLYFSLHSLLPLLGRSIQHQLGRCFGAKKLVHTVIAYIIGKSNLFP